jgi:hypothetical protein
VSGLVRLTGNVFWELRGAWASGRRISLSLDERCPDRRIEGYVTRVAATDSFVHVNGVHVPGDAVLAIHRPSMMGDSDLDPKRMRPQNFDHKGRCPDAPQREALFA